MSSSLEGVVPGCKPGSVEIGGNLDELLTREWLITNQIGAYASGTVVGCNTRRYHGLLIAAATPPMGRFLALSTIMEQALLHPDSPEEKTFDLATNEFIGAFCPSGADHLAAFHYETIPTFVFRLDGVEVTKEIILADDANAVAVRYRPCGAPVRLRLAPFLALRDFHHLRSAEQEHQMTFEQTGAGVMVHDLKWPEHTVHFRLDSGNGRFESGSQWWYRFHYRTDVARGQDGLEDLYGPGAFVCDLADGESCCLVAGADDPPMLDSAAAMERWRQRRADLAASVGAEADDLSRRLAVAGDAFVVRRKAPHGGEHPSTTILAGYPWFADWGRDAFVALPGLLLSTGRFDRAREVFRTFADHVSEGMIPNRFDDYSGAPHYNSIDASLWFAIAAERYVDATGDLGFWRDVLMPTIDAVLTAYHDGTRFDIHADADGLLTGGSHETQLTWMDAKLGDEVIAARHGKAVEINALWHSAHGIMADRCRGLDEGRAEHYAAAAEMIGHAFARTFWNEADGCLYDCVTNSLPDPSLRPNQIFAVSLPHGALNADQQKAVVRVVMEKLLTPMGLRSLSPDDPRYRRRYGGSWESRDRAYHQGTVWAWLIGAFIEAYLKVEGPTPFAVHQAAQWLEGFGEHLGQAGLGSISEIFDADPPHTPRGCIAQAWSVAEVLRAKLLVNKYASQADI